jgi:hypothetical protein
MCRLSNFQVPIPVKLKLAHLQTMVRPADGDLLHVYKYLYVERPWWINLENPAPWFVVVSCHRRPRGL